MTRRLSLHVTLQLALLALAAPAAAAGPATPDFDAAQAWQQFLAHGLHVTEARTGVLIFAALGDHQVEVVADEGIHSKVDQAVWADAVEVLARGLRRGDPAAGFVDAVALCGAVLAEHFPPAPRNRNEVEDKLVVI